MKVLVLYVQKLIFVCLLLLCGFFFFFLPASLKSKVQKNKLVTAGEAIEYRCLIRATNGKKTISTTVCIFEFVVSTMLFIKTFLLDELLLYFTRLLSEIQPSGYLGIKFLGTF